jgi:hypothetical protein
MPVIILCRIILSSIDAEKIEVPATTTLVEKYANEALVAPVVTFGGVSFWLESGVRQSVLC